jgi:single-stranded-DNA-specific exonuclease
VFSGIGFSLADKFHLLHLQKPVDVVFTLDENEWNNQCHLQMKVIDLRLSEPNGLLSQKDTVIEKVSC